MSVDDFLKIGQSMSQDYCACLIDETGEVYEISNGHLNALVDFYGEEDILTNLPKDIAPMFWLIEQTKVVVVDYENQVHSGELTQEQRKALIALSDAKKIRVNLFDIHGKYNL